MSFRPSPLKSPKPSRKSSLWRNRLSTADALVLTVQSAAASAACPCQSNRVGGRHSLRMHSVIEASRDGYSEGNAAAPAGRGA